MPSGYCAEFEDRDLENFLGFDDRVVCYLVYEGEQPVGLILSCEVVNFSAGGRCGLITNLYVVPERRGDGLAAALVKAVHREAVLRGWRMLEIASSTCTQQEKLYDFYLRNGFNEIEPQLRMRLR
ncbi:GNAT family N-acetyltransferase [Pseudomonas juntendi]|uniref:GNAT family N-acetyltransferase n=1 Tax=Pseudomonas juntendi TaxID=2666183 RepID=UPI003D36DA4A